MTLMPWRPSLWTACLALLLCSSLFVPPVSADEDDEPAPGAPAPEDPAPEDPAPDEAAPGERPDVHKLYVPFKDLSKVFEREDEGVFLPYAEFKKLWEKAYKLPADRGAPPVPAAVRSATYRGTTDGEMIRFEADLDVEVLKSFQQLER